MSLGGGGTIGGRSGGRTWDRRVLRWSPFILFVGIVAGISVWRDSDGSDILSDLWFAVVGTFILMGPVSFIVLNAGELRGTEATARQLEEDAEGIAVESLAEYVAAQLKAAGARQEVSVVKAEKRADRLAAAGFGLMLSSVLVPFGLVYLYVNLEPAGNLTPAVSRDWHLLLAGVSFGLLFIASARGILSAEARQREVYARELRETSYYGDLRRALGIAERLDHEQGSDSGTTIRVATTIMEQMLVRERSARPAAAPAAGDQSDQDGRGAIELFKIIADGARALPPSKT